MKTRNLLLLLALLLMPAAGAVAASPAKLTSRALFAKFQKPDNDHHPFVRWWWNGDAVDSAEIVRELGLLHAAGIGGVEINPISMPSRADRHGHKTLQWLSPEWIHALSVAFAEAKRLGMTCDLIVGSGWPFGSETLPQNERASVMLTAAIKLEPGSHAEMTRHAIFASIDPGVSVVNYARTPHLVAAYLVPDSITSLKEAREITAEFEGQDGRFVMDVPEDAHLQLYALVKYDAFACVINGAPGAAGSILDHMNAEAVNKYLHHMTDRIEPVTGPLSGHLRSFFVDSMELEGTNWSHDFRSEFERRRGYDIMPWLPFTMFKVGRLGDVVDYNFGAKKSPAFKNLVDRARYDFELTKAELLHERFTKVYAQWCREKGVRSRAQAYGRGFFIEEPSMEMDIPEGESWTTNWLRHKLGEEMGDQDYRRGRGYTMIDKYVSSAAHLTGKRLVSCEEMTNTYLVFNTPLELLKIGTDMSAFAGVTHSVWHGFNYSPQDAAFPGWIQYGSYYNENNTWFPYWHLLNEYRARMSAMLQNMDMQTDIALLPANADLWTELGVQTEPFPNKLNVDYTSLVWEAIHKNGGGADYVSERILADATVSGGRLCYGAKSYGTIFLVGVQGTTQEVMDRLLQFVQGGGRVFCIGTYPTRSLGMKDYEARDARLLATVEQLKGYKDRFILLDKPQDGKYLEWYTDVMRRYRLPHAVEVSQPDRFVLINRYKADGGDDALMVANASLSDEKETTLTLPREMTRGRQVWLYNPADGQRYRLPIDGQQIHLRLAPAECFFVVLNKLADAKAPLWEPLPAADSTATGIGHWQVALTHKREGWTKTMQMDTLQDLCKTEYKHFMGTATYTTTLRVEKGKQPRWLDLGKACEIAEVTINGRPAGTRWFSRKVLPVSGLLHEGDNTIEVRVTTLMGNYMQSLTDNKAAQQWVIKRKHPMRSMGLIGPVRAL